MASLHLTHLHQRWLLFFLFFPSTLASFTEHVRRFCYFFPSSSCQSYSRLTCRPVTITLLQQHHRHDISPKSITITIITPCSSSSPSMIQAKLCAYIPTLSRQVSNPPLRSSSRAFPSHPSTRFRLFLRRRRRRRPRTRTRAVMAGGRVRIGGIGGFLRVEDGS